MTTLAFIGFGEAGQSIAAGLIESGMTVPAAHDILFRDEAGGAGPRAAASRLGVAASSDPEGAVAGADIVLSAVTSDQTVIAAGNAAPHLKSGQIYMDINSASPGMKREAAALVEGVGAHFVEAAVMATVPPYGHKVPMLLAGTSAEELAGMLRPFGMDVEPVGAEIGQASGIKMCRSVMVKGLEALFIECLGTAHRLGVEERVLDSLYESFPGFDWRKYAGYHLSRAALHARRRAAEMREVTDTVAEAGLDPWMAAATSKVLDAVDEAGWKSLFPEGVPEDYRVFLATVNRG